MSSILVLRNTIQEYSWGSRTAIPELLGLPSPAEKPQAELWMGAHPKAPSRAIAEGREVPLPELIRRDPEGVLGQEAARRFGGELPFLFKIIAAAAPLSIQVHPTAEQAREGFRRENEAGIPLEAFERNYRDPNHKPEVLSALTPFWALNGFRPIVGMARLFRWAAGATLAAEIDALAAEPTPEGLRGFFASLMRLPPGRRSRIVKEVAAWASTPEHGQGPAPGVAATAGAAAPGRAPRPATTAEIRSWILRIRDHYPGDIGVLAPLFLNLVELRPGDTMFLEAGIPHAYLEGAGIELMANSDNVLRGGLTPKHVDVPELLRTIRFESAPVAPATGEPQPGGEIVFRTPAPEFRLSEIRPDAKRGFRSAEHRNVEILLCVSGTARLETLPGGAHQTLRIERGTSLLVPAAAPGYRLRGRARLFKATVP